ncbi:MAG: hypothetical protein JHC60_19590, partial [Sphingobium sp.]|nr:hypothetical protein [Sphingobium sp.]
VQCSFFNLAKIAASGRLGQESATNAEVKLIEAQARIAAARAELAAATADEDALGLAVISE